MQNLANVRKDYASSQLRRDQLLSSPFDMLRNWLNEVSDLPDFNAMVLSTVFEDKPSSRVVLLKDLTTDFLAWFTSYESQKGHELTQNPNASLVFFWPQKERQVRVEGVVEKAPQKMSDAYFLERPLASRFSAWASPQSKVIKSRDFLESELEKVKQRFGDEPTRPEWWGGYCLFPLRFEFWQGRPNRLHDRWVYKRETRLDEWVIEQIAP